VPQLVARGLVPADLRAYFIQHLKWSHGVFHILFEISVPLLRRLKSKQALCYLTRMTYYFVGPVAFLQMLTLIGALFFAKPLIQDLLASFLIHLTTAMLAILAIQLIMLILWEIDPAAPILRLRSAALAFGTWPIYTFSLANVLLHRRLGHIATPKEARGGQYLWLVIPQIAMVALFIIGIIQRVAVTEVWDGNVLIIIGFALMMIAWHGVVFYGVWEGWQLQRRHSKYKLQELDEAL
jgi:cellulose synthase/poly-beta-1,6-N-acetylglucosamine synthase-like glycosyltransferase